MEAQVDKELLAFHGTLHKRRIVMKCRPEVFHITYVTAYL
jgi:hypothetical protein